MKFLFSFYKIINALSIDVALGAMICSCFFVRYFNIEILSQDIIVLGLIVWIIYTVDHLMDAKKLTHGASMFRHQFHQKYFAPLLLVVLIATLLSVVLLLYIEQRLFLAGLVVGLLSVGYVLLNRWFLYTKEFVGTLVYCLGVLLPAFTFHQKYFSAFDWVVMGQFFLTVLTNMILFSWMDHEEDVKDQYHSLSTRLGKKQAAIILKLLFLLIFIFSVYILSNQNRLGIIYLLMALVLLVIFLFPDYFKKDGRYRFVGDAIFFFPIILLI